MLKQLFMTATILSCLGAINPVKAQKAKQGNTSAVKTDVKFIEDISLEPITASTISSDPKPAITQPVFAEKKSIAAAAPATIEGANTLQFKYALLLNLEVEQIQNLSLFRIIDEWMGTRYKLGGSSKDGIDCSALMQILFSSLYAVTLPRTAREQFGFSRRISRTELKEGDLVFFNTVGGVSHVGMYLQNNKFIHASSNGVTISDLYEDYWLRRFVGVGRVDIAQPVAALSSRL
ncbi:MAG TPA: C40 family peptidase [Flavisolibacter sp.]|nr:C40 family peptidase [Flavisolibacter sp.]